MDDSSGKRLGFRLAPIAEVGKIALINQACFGWETPHEPTVDLHTRILSYQTEEIMAAGSLYWPIVRDALTVSSLEWDDSEAFWDSYNNLSPKARCLMVAHFTDAEICNGGLHQFFSNSTGVFGEQAPKAFLQIGMPKAAAILSTAAHWFAGVNVLCRSEREKKLADHRMEVNQTVVQASRKDWDPFYDLDETYYELRDHENDGFLIAADRFAGAVDRL